MLQSGHESATDWRTDRAKNIVSPSHDDGKNVYTVNTFEDFVTVESNYAL